MGAYSDADLLNRYRRGDEAALEEILERFERPLYLFLLGTLRDHHAAEDALQETFIQSLERIDSIDPDHLRGWLFTVAYHQAMLLRRKLAARARHFPAAPEGAADALPDHHVGPADLAMSREEAERCRRWLEQLPESQREVIRLRIYEGKRFREIAASLGCPLNTALARMHQGLKRLRSLEEMNHAG